MATTITQPTRARLTRTLLACGVAYAVAYVVVNNVIAAAGMQTSNSRRLEG
jgi:hypothetical protein